MTAPPNGVDSDDGDKESTKPVVLVVDDEPRVTQAFALWLDDYDVRTAQSGEEALELLDGVDVVLLDRRMPGMDGSEVLEAIRERGHDCRVAMVTGVSPELDVVEMEFDDYLEKPVDPEELAETVERLLSRADYDDRITNLLSVTRKIELLRTEHLEDDEEFESLLAERDRLKDETDEMLSDLGPEEFAQIMSDL
ncbi:MAG: response regulator [Halobacteriales archaeon]|nr:response regulator [Halobacteriales archaeon]